MRLLDRCLHLLIGLGLAAAMHGALAQSKGPVESFMDQWVKSGQLKITGPKRPYPRELTDEQRAMLTESPKLFPWVEVEGVYLGTHVYWMDEVRLITSTLRHKDWRMADGELPKIIIFNTETKTFEETPYRGVLECFTPERMVVVEHRNGWVGRGQVTGDKDKPFPVLAGRFGDVLKTETYTGFHTRFNKFTCKAFNPKNDPPANELYRMRPLRDGDGAVGYSFGSTNMMARPQLVLFDASGKVYAEQMIGAEPTIDKWFYYNTTTRRYFYSFSGNKCGDTSKGSATPGETLSFRVGVGWESHPTPALFVNMLDWCVGQLSTVDTAAGIIYIAASVFDPRIHLPTYNRGLYFQVGDKMHRFFKAHAGIAAISPSGCRVFAPYIPDDYDPSPAGAVPKARIFNVCQGDKK